MDQLSSLVDVRENFDLTLFLKEGVKDLTEENVVEAEHNEGYQKDVLHIRDLHCSVECRLSVLNGVKPLCKSLCLLPVNFYIAQQQIDGLIHSFPDYSRGETSVKDNDALLATTEKRLRVGSRELKERDGKAEAVIQKLRNWH